MKKDGTARHLVAARLREWMRASDDLKTQVAVAQKSGLVQSTIGRILRADVDVTVDNLFRIADAFNREAGDLLRADPESGRVAYDHERYSRLPAWEKSRIEAFIRTVIAENTKT